MECPYCQAKNPDNARYCNNCGRELFQKCTNCSASLQPEAQLCNACGKPVPKQESSLYPSGTDVQEMIPAPFGARESGRESPGDVLHRYIPRELLRKLDVARSSHLMVGERRIVTILFCDVKGSTEAASKLDPEEWAEIINGAFVHMIQPIYRYEGTVARLMGDGLLAFFGAPIAHEDDPQRAVLAGLDILQAVKGYADEIKTRWGIDFEVRVGINTGLVVVGAVGSDLRMEYSALGDAINIAARMEQTAEPGSVQIAEATYRLVEPMFDVNPVDDLKVKGHDELLAFRVLRRKENAGRMRGVPGLHSPMVGRIREMAALESALNEIHQGTGCIVSVIGEAGQGKSRLISEFRQQIFTGRDQNIGWMEGHALSYDSAIPFALFANLFVDFFQLKRNGSDRSRYEQIASRMDGLTPGSGIEMAPYFAVMLGIGLENEPSERVRYLEPVRLRSLIFEKVIAFFEELTSNRQVILFLDDLHWSDPTSLELLEMLLPLTKARPLMVIAAFRPQKQEALWQFHESVEGTYGQRYKTIFLNSLEDSQARHLIANLLTIENLPEKVKLAILEKAEGNPFYIEEVIRSLIGRGLVVTKDGHWQATQAIHDFALPASLAGLITARLDRLDESTKYILQAAAVIGREFTLETLRGMVDMPDQVESSLIELQGWELVRESGQPGGQSYLFKHVLTLDAAYDSILLSNRRELHRRAADTLIHVNPGAVAEIARHLVEARQAGRSIPYLLQAGEQAARAYAVAEAQSYFQQAIEFLPAEGEVGLIRRAYEGLGGVYQFSNRFPEAMDTYTKMLSIAESVGDIQMQISATNKLASVMAIGLGNFQEAEQLLDRAEKLSRNYGELSGIPETSLLRCQICTIQGDFDQAVYYLDEVIKTGQELDNREDILLGLEHVSASLVFLTRFDEAQKKAEEGLKLAREIGDKEHEAHLLAFPLPVCYLRNGDFALARECLYEAIAIAEKIGLLSAQGDAGYWLTETARWQGEYEKSLYYGQKTLNAVGPLEPYMPFVIVPVLGSLGMVYLDISEEFKDQISQFHNHALRILESPVGKTGGGTAWADLALCALQLKDMKVAEEAVKLGLNYPNFYMRLDRPRHLAAAALLAQSREDIDEAVRLAEEACAYAEERGMRYLYPLLFLILGKLLAARGDAEAGVKSLSRAEKQASELGMRSYIWQARAATAEALASTGDMEQAGQKLEEAKEAALEIASLFKDDELRQAYERNVSEKIGGLLTRKS